jgi:hypothetical protein
MLKIEIPPVEVFNEDDNSFHYTKPITLSLEHSLVSVSKWESKWCVPFLSTNKIEEQIRDYIRCMTVTQNIDEEAYKFLNSANFNEINIYIDAPMSATIITNDDKRTNKEVITSEIIYYWMITLGIPFECQKWHLNRLLMLINVCSIKQQKPRRMSAREATMRNRALNEQRKAQLNTLG